MGIGCQCHRSFSLLRKPIEFRPEHKAVCLIDLEDKSGECSVLVVTGTTESRNLLGYASSVLLRLISVWWDIN